MLAFNDGKIRKEQENGVSIIPATERFVDKICEIGYDHIFYIGIGGTAFYAAQMAQIVKQQGAPLPLSVENAADFCLVGNPCFTSKSIVVLESISGDTKEMVQAVDKVHEAGAKVLGYVEKVDSPLYEKVDYLVSTQGGAYYFWYTATLRFLNNAGFFPQYTRLMEDMARLPENAAAAYCQMEEKAKAYADQYCDEPLQYLVASGNLEHWAYCYGMCIMEEMQWMRTRPLSASDFFHGALEVIDRDTPVMLIKGEDITRPLMDRVERFVHKISAKVTVFDTKAFKLEGIHEEFRGILSPILMRTAFQRISEYLEYNRRHPLAIRRYYRYLDY